METDKYASVVINETKSEPLSDYVIDFLINQKKESPYLDFKFTMHVSRDSDFPEIAKDIFAFSNYGGGWILLGWKEEPKNTFIPEGLPDDFNADQATIQEKFNSFVSSPIEILYKPFSKHIDGRDRRFAALFIPPSNSILKPIKEGKYKKGEKERLVFKSGDTFYRRGTQSIPPSPVELKLIEKRLEQENYRLSILSGEPDQVDEELLSNLFEVTKLPQQVFLGQRKFADNASIKVFLKQNNIFPEFFFKFKDWDGKIVTFENLSDTNNPYSKIVEANSVTSEPIENWLSDRDKSRVIMELLNREIKHHAIASGMFYSKDHDKLFYASKEPERHEHWKSQYRESKKSVAARFYAEQIGAYIFCHPAFYISFVALNKKIFMRILPTFIITHDGKNALSGSTVGTIITRLSYNKYNYSYLNTILFWIQKLSNGANIQIRDYLEITSTPTKSKLNMGILFDAPSAQFKLEVDDDIPESEAGVEDD